MVPVMTNHQRRSLARLANGVLDSKSLWRPTGRGYQALYGHNRFPSSPGAVDSGFGSRSAGSSVMGPPATDLGFGGSSSRRRYVVYYTTHAFLSLSLSFCPFFFPFSFFLLPTTIVCYHFHYYCYYCDCYYYCYY